MHACTTLANMLPPPPPPPPPPKNALKICDRPNEKDGEGEG